MAHKPRFWAIAMIGMIAILLAGCAAPPSAATPVPTQPPPPTSTPASSADPWERIQKEGAMVVGTSADYAPYEYYNRSYRLDGFDIELMREIGKRLGVKVDFKDMAFDGLYNAIQLGRIDSAIAAISVTPERQKYVDFTDTYYAGQDGVLAGKSSKIGDITQLEQMADKKVGVQSGSVYETELMRSLVATKLMPAGNVSSYPDIDQAVKDLNRGQIDLVWLDYQPATQYVDAGNAKMAGQGLEKQTYSIAVPKGADSLRRVMNQAISELLKDGTITKLAEMYLGLKPADVLPVPTPTPVPAQPTAVAPQPTSAPAACIDDMAYVADLNYDDHNMTAPPVLAPGQAFTKSWRVRNTGTCTWNSAYQLTFVSGTQMGGQPVSVKGTVPPGATYDFSANLVAPTQPGVYQSFWQMRNGKGVAFGDRIYVGIQVKGAPTATPAATQTPSPTISFGVDRTSITAGECVTFSWNVTNVKAVYFYAEGQNWQDHGVAGQGQQTVCPTQTTTYYLRVVRPDNSVETRSITIYVTPAVSAPQIAYFTAAPPTINLGGCATLQWEVSGEVSRVTISRGDAVIWDGAPVRGSMQDCPTAAGSISYGLLAAGPGGQGRGQTYVNVVAPQPTAVPPTAVPPTAVPPTAVPPTAVPPTAVPPTQPPPTPPIEGKNWGLTNYNNGVGGWSSVIAGTTITAFFGPDGKVSGSDGCNSYNAAYTATATNLTVGGLTKTGMACPDDVMQQANAYTAALQGAVSYQVAGSTLTIFGNGGSKLLEYTLLQ